MTDNSVYNTSGHDQIGRGSTIVGNGIIVGKQIHIEGDFVVNVSNQAERYGLSLLYPKYFIEHDDTKQDLEKWKNGFPFELPSIMKEREFRRNNIIDHIKNMLEDQHRLLIVGESGTSKTTILMEVMCLYFKDGYQVLYSYGDTEIEKPDELVKFIEDQLNNGNKILVAVDNVHNERIAAVFYVMDKLTIHNKRNNIRFLLTARIPEYNSFVKKGLYEMPQENYAQSIRTFRDDPNFKYELPFFSEDEIRKFIIKYQIVPDDKSIALAKRTYKETSGGHPIMVKFYLLQHGLLKDVEDRFGRYLQGPMNIRTMLVCSLLDIANLRINDKLLQDLGLLNYAYKLDKATLYQSYDIWKTIHSVWDVTLLYFLYNESNKEIISERIAYLKDAIHTIFNYEKKSNKKERTISTIRVIYAIAGFRHIPINIAEQVTTEINDYLSPEEACELYALHIAKSYGELGIYDKAIASCDKAIKINSNYPIAWNEKGVYLDRQGNFQDAINCYDEALRIKPRFVNALTNKGFTFDKIGMHFKAFQNHLMATVFDPTFAIAFNNAGLSLAQDGNLGGALEYYDKAINIKPEFDKAWYNKGNLLETMQNYEEALKCYDKAIEINPDYDKAWNGKGNVLFKLRNYEEALKCYDKAIARNMLLSSVFAFHQKGNVLFKLRNYEEALKCYDKAIELEKKYGMMDANTWHQKGNVLFKLRNYEEALKCYDKAIDIDYRNAEAYDRKAQILSKTGQKNEANKLFHKAWVYRGVALAEVGNHEKAIGCYDKAVSYHYKDMKNDETQGFAWAAKGISLSEVGKYEKAIACYDKAIKINSLDDAIWNNKGLALDALKRTKKAIACYDKAIEINPQNAVVWLNKSESLKRLGIDKNLKEIVRCYNKAIKLDPSLDVGLLL